MFVKNNFMAKQIILLGFIAQNLPVFLPALFQIISFHRNLLNSLLIMNRFGLNKPEKYFLFFLTIWSSNLFVMREIMWFKWCLLMQWKPDQNVFNTWPKLSKYSTNVLKWYISENNLVTLFLCGVVLSLKMVL